MTRDPFEEHVDIGAKVVKFVAESNCAITQCVVGNAYSNSSNFKSFYQMLMAKSIVVHLNHLL